MKEEEIKRKLFEKAVGQLKEWYHDEETLEEVYKKWYQECKGSVPDEFSENLLKGITDKFYVILSAVRDLLAEEGLIKDYEAPVTVMPNAKGTTFSVLTWGNVVLAEYSDKAWHFEGTTAEGFKTLLYKIYTAAKRRVEAYTNLKRALEELEMARCNAEDCPEHRDEADGLTELEHVDIHVEGAISYLRSFLNTF